MAQVVDNALCRRHLENLLAVKFGRRKKKTLKETARATSVRPSSGDGDNQESYTRPDESILVMSDVRREQLMIFDQKQTERGHWCTL